MPKRVGRKSVAQTPAPKSDKIYGSKKNKVGSASSEKTAKSIKLSEQTEKVLKNKLSEFKEEHPNKKSVTLSDLKAVYRRGSGAYSKSHRPTITGGAPNSRAAWSYARVNKFLKKAGGEKVKAAYVQDDDLFARGGKTKGGDCYVKAGGFCLLPNSYDFIGEPYLVHAEVRGQGKIEGLRYGHAWVEDDENVYDFSNGREIIMPKQIYYYFGDVKTENPNKYRRYTFPEARDKMLKTSNYGSWDIETEYANGGLIAPNGKASNLIVEQYKLVRTTEFKAWFGDWENDPQNASKVVDENGEPLVVYHGSANNFNVFDKKRVGENYFESKQGGFFFTQKLNSAKNYARLHTNLENDGFVYYCFLNIRNPLVRNTNSEYYSPADRYDISRHEYISELKSKKNIDGIIIFGTKKDNLYVVNNSNQIKLADGTNTTFDIDNQDIRYKDGGKLFNDKELLSKWKKGQSIGFTGIAHLKAKGLIPRADGIKRKSAKYMEDGGETSQQITCINCGWKWEIADSDEYDKYVCHQCGFDNTLYYGNIMSKFKKPMSVSEISKEHGVDDKYIDNQLDIGIKHELEHTTDEGIARIIALHHIGEKPNYYELVEKYKLEDGGQPSKFWHKSEKYEIVDFIQNEKNATKELLCSSDTRISKAIICRAKIDFCEKKEINTNNFEVKNAWSEVKNIWEDCLFEVKNGVVYEFNDGGECGCASKSKEYKDGGLAYGNSHDKGGMPLKVESTGQNIEIEGGEGVINKRSMQMKKRIDFEGKKLTPCQIVSKINEMGGGVKFKCEDVEEILEKDGSF
jgi:hypothetical protein